MSAATQNQALCAIIFMYRHILHKSVEGLQYGFAKRPRNLPAVLSPIEVATILSHMQGKYRLITSMLYGCGFRIKEVLALRIKDIDFLLPLVAHIFMMVIFADIIFTHQHLPNS